MAGAAFKFSVASVLMWMAPIAILYGFNHNLFPGLIDLSPHSLTLLSGFLAVLSVNMMIGFYIYLAMKEPLEKHEPDPKFFAQAQASIEKPVGATEAPSQHREKEEQYSEPEDIKQNEMRNIGGIAYGLKRPVRHLANRAIHQMQNDT